MPVIKSCYGINPKTQEQGIWLELANNPGVYFGVTQTYINSITPLNPNSTNTTTFKNTLQTQLQSVINQNVPAGAPSVTDTILIKNVNPLVWSVMIT